MTNDERKFRLPWAKPAPPVPPPAPDPPGLLPGKPGETIGDPNPPWPFSMFPPFRSQKERDPSPARGAAKGWPIQK